MTIADADKNQKILLGREGEVRILHQAYQRSVIRSADVHHNNDVDGCCSLPELVLIRGRSGTGKTVLANTLQQALEQDDGFFLSGKFELTNAPAAPYTVFVSAFSQFTDQLLLQTALKDEGRLSKMRQVVQQAIGSDAKLLFNIIPALERIIGTPQDEGNESQQQQQGTEALRRFQFLFCKLCLAVSTVAPIVLFLDDLQWSDTASLQLLQAMLQSRPAHHDGNFSLLVVGAYRDEELENDTANVFSSSATALTFSDYLAEIQALTEVNITHIHLHNLSEAVINKMVSDILEIPITSTSELGPAVFSVCNGNPLHALQIVKDLLKRSLDESYKMDANCEWNDPQFLKVAIWTRSVDELFCSKLTLLSKPCLKVLQVAACMGDEIDESAVAMVLDAELPDVLLSVKEASSEGHCILDIYRGRYRFAHDRIRQAALSMIVDKDALSFQIGYKLWTKSSPLFLSTHKFMVAHLLNCGMKLITDQSERYNAAAFNLEVGIEAASKADFPDSSRFLSAGIDLLKSGGDCCYWTEQYDLSLMMFCAAVDTEVCIQNFDRVQDLAINEILKHAHSLHDKLTAYSALINSFGQQGMITEAMTMGMDVLRQLNEPLPHAATKVAIIWDVVKTKFALRGRSNDDLLCLKPMNDVNKLAALHVLTVLIPYMYQAASFYTPLLGTRLVRLCLKFGMHKSCAIGFATFGVILCGSDPKEGYRLGSLALLIVQRWRARALLPRVHGFFYGLIHHWQCPLRDSLEPLHNAIQVAMETGDVECAMIARFYLCSNWLLCGKNLCESEKLIVESTQQMHIYKQENLLKFTNVLLQYVQNLTGSVFDPNAFSGEIASKHVPVRVTYFVWGSNLAFRLGNYELANELVAKANELNFKPFAQYGFSVRIQTEALLAIARARLGLISTRKALKIGKAVYKKMKSWTHDCPENFSFKCNMVEAELRSLKGGHNYQSRNHQITMSLYDATVEDALRQGFTHEAALACELAGDHLHRQGNAAKATTYWLQAHSLYITWGATSKASQLVAKTGCQLLDDGR